MNHQVLSGLLQALREGCCLRAAPGCKHDTGELIEVLRSRAIPIVLAYRKAGTRKGVPNDR